LSDILDPVGKKYDLILIDTPPNLGIITLNALIASEGIVLVYTASEFSLDGMSQILNTFDDIKRNPRLNINKTKIIGAIQNRYKKSTKVMNREIDKALEGVSDIPKYFPLIMDTTEIEKSQLEHKPIHLFNKRHEVTGQFENFGRELLSCLG